MTIVRTIRRVLAVTLSASLIVVPEQGAAAADLWSARRAPRAAPTPQFASIALPPLSSALSAVIHPAPPALSAPAKDASPARRLASAVPAGRANVVDISEGQGLRPPVVILQDVHLNAEAQENAAAALEALLRAGVRVVGQEGAFGDVDVSRFRSFPDKEALSDIAGGFLKQGRLGAPSFLAVTRPDAFRLVGVDDRARYDANARAVMDGTRERAAASAALTALRRDLDGAKPKLLNPDLRRFDAARGQWSRGDIGIGAYLTKVAAFGAPVPPAVDEFLRAFAMERGMDFARIEAQRRAVLEALTRKLDAKGLSDLVASALAFRAGTLSIGDYHRGLRDVCRRAGLDLSATPDFDAYVRYVGMAEHINAERLFASIGAMEAATVATLAKTPDERATMALSAQLDRADKLVRFSLTPDEWRAYARERAPLPALTAAVSRLTGAPAASATVSLDPFEAFYAEAEARSASMVAALLAAPGEGPRVLVTGGYHAPEMRGLLAARGVPVVTLSPRLTRVDGDPTAYLAVFSREKTPLDRLFAGEKLFLNPLESTVGSAVTAARVADEAAHAMAAKLPVGGRAAGPGGLAVEHPRASLTHVMEGGRETWLSGTGARSGFRTVGPAVVRGVYVAPRWTLNAARSALARVSSGLAGLNVTASLRRLAVLESALKAAALPALVSTVAPSLAGSAALMTPLGLLALAAASIALTIAWMGTHVAVDALRTLATGDRYQRDWGRMWRNALLLNAAGLAAVVGVGLAGLFLGPTVSPEGVYGIAHGLGHVILNALSPVAAGLSLAALRDETRKKPTATEWVDGDFHGVDLEHYVHAQNRLADQLLDENPANTGPGSLSGVLSALGLTRGADRAANYRAIYAALADGRYDARILDLINANSYADPRLDLTITKQSPNPLVQSIDEAVANSLDAMGLKIGQFGKGIKQVLDWLRPGSGDRIEVVTRTPGGVSLMLVIRQDAAGRNFIQIRRDKDAAEFLDRLGPGARAGTSLRVVTERAIPRRITDEKKEVASQQRIIEAIQFRFPYIAMANIVVRHAGHAAEEVNGYDKKEFIVPAGKVARHETDENNVVLAIDDHSITVSDNGKGMDARILSRMFANRTSKDPVPVVGDAVDAELAKIEIVRDRTLPNRLSFASNGRVAFAVDVPDTVVRGAAIEGGLMIELGRLVSVPEERGNLILPAAAKTGQPTIFSRGIMEAVRRVLEIPEPPAGEPSSPGRYTKEDKLRILNTIVIGLDGLSQGNPVNEEIVRNLRAEIHREIRPAVEALRSAGVIILPHGAEYQALRIPEGRRVLYLHEGLFAWNGAAGLRDLGGEEVPGILLGGDKRLPLVVVPFQGEAVNRARRFHEEWHSWPASERLPVVRTGRFIAIATEQGGRFLELSRKRSVGLSKAEDDEFNALLKKINILTAEEVNPNYSVTPMRPNATVETRPITLSEGELDSEEANHFLVEPPAGVNAPEATGRPADARIRFVHFHGTENIYDLKTGRSRSIPGLRGMVPLENNYVILLGDRNKLETAALYRFDSEGVPKFVTVAVVTPSPRGKFVTGFSATGVDIFSTEDREFLPPIPGMKAVGFTPNDWLRFGIFQNGDGSWKLVRTDEDGYEPVEIAIPAPTQDYPNIEAKSSSIVVVHGVGSLGTVIVDMARDRVVESARVSYVDPGGRFYFYELNGALQFNVADGRSVTFDMLGFMPVRIDVSPDGTFTFHGPEGQTFLLNPAPVPAGTRFYNAFPGGGGPGQPQSTLSLKINDDVVTEEYSSADPSLHTRWLSAQNRELYSDEKGFFTVVAPDGGKVTLPLGEKEYHATFDGKYFVFTPDGPGPVHFVDPRNPANIRTVDLVSRFPAFSGVPPVEIAGAHVISREVKDGNETFFLIGPDGKRVELPDSVRRVERVSDSVFRLEYDTLGTVHARVDKDGTLKRMQDLDPGTLNLEPAVGVIGPYFVKKTHAGFFKVVDAHTGAAHEYDQVAISRSGRFLITRDRDKVGIATIEDGQVVHRQWVSGIASFTLSEMGDILELTDREGDTRCVFPAEEITPDNGIPSDLSFITVDDSGHFALFPESRSVIAVSNGKTYEWPADAGGRLRIAEDDDTVYLELPDGQELLFDKKTGQERPTPAEVKWPAFWRVYSDETTNIEGTTTPNIWGKHTSLLRADDSPQRGDRNELIGSFATRGAFIMSLDNPDDASAETLPGRRDTRFLRRHRLVLSAGSGLTSSKQKCSYIPENGPTVTGSVIGAPIATASGRQVILRTEAGLMLFAGGKPRLLNAEIPEGFSLTDVFDETFVFVNDKGERRYARFPDEVATNGETARLWNEGVLDRRDALVAAVRAAWQPLVSFVPAAYQGDLAKDMRDEIRDIYNQDEDEVEKRFAAAVAAGGTVDLDTPLPSSRFAARVQRILPALAEAMPKLEEEMMRENGDAAVRFYDDLFTHLFDLARSPAGVPDALDLDLLRLMGHGFRIDTSEDIEDARAVSVLVTSLRDNANARVESLRTLVSFLNAALKKSDMRPALRTQIRRMAAAPAALQIQLVSAFATARLKETLLPFLQGREAAYQALGPARPFAVFLTQPVNPVEERDYVLEAGTDRYLDERGVSLAVLQLIEDARDKGGETGKVMTVDFLLRRLEAARAGREALPVPEAVLEARLRNNVEVQREAGAYAAEVTQNAIDATKEVEDGRLDIAFYTRRRAGLEEFVEEMKDNGTGALQEIALDISASTKEGGGQVNQGGFFGSGKFTIFRGVDRVEIITKNKDRAYLFEYAVDRDPATGEVLAIRKTRIRELTDPALPLGVTIRRVKLASNTIPELDQMLALRGWKTFAGLAQKDRFKIYVPGDKPGERRPLEVKSEVVAEMPYYDETGKDWGAIRLIRTKDMPTQVIDRLGVRVKELAGGYLDLIPGPLRRHVEEMGLTVQVPLPLIRNRSGFAHENVARLQAYVAALFYQALAKRVLTETGPQFVFEGFPLDWETNASYWNEIRPYADRQLMDLAAALNSGDMRNVDLGTLVSLRIPEGQLDKEKRFVKLILQLEASVPTANGEKRVSALQRRLAIQMQIDAARAAEQARRTGQSASDAADIPHLQAKLAQAAELRRIEDIDLNRHVFQPKTAQERANLDRFHDYALGIARLFGMSEVVVLDDLPGETLPFAGLFSGDRMYLHQSLVDLRGPEITLSSATETIIHEISHLFESYMRGERGGLVVDVSGLTHDAVGTFAEGMKYAAAVALANHDPAVFRGGNMEWLRAALNAVFRLIGLPQMSRAGYNAAGSWIAEGGLLIALGGLAYVLAPWLDFRTIYDLAWVAFPLLHLADAFTTRGRENLTSRVAVATLISVLMSAVPGAASPGALIALTFLVHAAVNNGLAAVVSAASRVRREGVQSLLPARTKSERPRTDTRAADVRRVSAALVAFAGRAAAGGTLRAGQTVLLSRLLAALPDERVRVSDIAGRGGRTGLRRFLEEPSFDEGDFMNAVRAAVRQGTESGNLKAEDYLPLLTALAQADVSATAMGDLFAAATTAKAEKDGTLRAAQKVAIVANGPTDEARVLSLLNLMLDGLLAAPADARRAEVELVVPAGQRERFERIATAWRNRLAAAGRSDAGTIKLIDQPADLITGGTLNLQRLSAATSLERTMLMVPNTLTVNTAGVAENLLQSLVIATIEDALAARTMTGETLNNIAKLAAVIARQA